jgi:hypothetical protein
MSELAVIVTWYGTVSLLGLNGCGAGVAAMLYIWRRSMRPGARAVVAASLTGLLPASLVIAMMFTERELVLGEGLGILLLAFAALFAVSTLVALPGALVVTRRLAQPGDDHRYFE